MGLDMWLYKGIKPKEDSVALHPNVDELYRLDYHCYDLEKIDDERLYEDLLPCCIKRRGTYKGYDWETMRLDYDVSATAHAGGWSLSPEINSFRYYDGDKKYTIDITNEEMEKYSRMYESEFLITKFQEIAYFRKEFDLQEHIYDTYHLVSGKDIHNCGYHLLTKEMISELNKIDNLFRRKGIEEDFDSLYYHEWY